MPKAIGFRGPLFFVQCKPDKLFIERFLGSTTVSDSSDIDTLGVRISWPNRSSNLYRCSCEMQSVDLVYFSRWSGAE